jgi:hypothetical protein
MSDEPPPSSPANKVTIVSNEQEHLKKIHDKDANNYVSSSVFDDLAGLRKAQKVIVVRKTVLVNVKVDKPPNNQHFRAHPEWYLDDASIVQDRGTGTFYYVHPVMRTYPKLAPIIRYVTLAVVFLWPSSSLMIWPVPKLEGGKRKDFPVWKSARVAYESSRDQWMQITWNELNRDYNVETAEKISVEPQWPTDKSFTDLLKLGFDGKIIDNEDHEYVRQLRGLDT